VFKLLSTSGEQSIDLAPGRILVVGRAVTSDIPIYDPTISRRHAEVSLGPAGVRVVDLGSSNGTFVNGARITQADATTNDVITFGKVAFKVASITPPARPSTPTPDSGQTSEARGILQGTIVHQLPVSPSSGGVPALVHGGTAAATPGGGHLKVAAQTEAERREKKLSLFEIAMELARQQELEQVLSKVVDVTFQTFNVDRVSILLLDPHTSELVPRLSRSRTGDTNTSRHVPMSIARKAVDDRVATLSDNAATDDRFKGKSVLIQSVRSAMCTPLLGSDQKVIGILYVDNEAATKSFTDEDLEFLVEFGGLCASAIDSPSEFRRIMFSPFQRYSTEVENTGAVAPLPSVPLPQFATPAPKEPEPAFNTGKSVSIAAGFLAGIKSLVGRDDRVLVGAAAPECVRPGEEFVAWFVAYRQHFESAVRRQLEAQSPRAIPRLGIERCRWALGTFVQVKVAGNHLVASPQQEEFVWDGEYKTISFDLRALPDAPLGVTVLKFDVYIGPLRVARVRLDLSIAARAKVKNIRHVTAKPARTAFASYAADDHAEVLGRISSITTSTGLDVFVDCLSLRPGEKWKARLRREIRKRNLFLLFWSPQAMASEWVEWEWRTALAERGLDIIQPHPLKPVSVAPPPPELEGLHFGDAYVLARHAYERAM